MQQLVEAFRQFALRGLRSRRIGLTAAAMLAAAVLAPASASADFQLGLEDPGLSYPKVNTTAEIGFKALKAVHGTTVRLYVPWSSVAPPGAKEPAGFNPSNPSDPRYNWAAVDAEVRSVAAHHNRAVMTLTLAPAWAQPTGKPSFLAPFFGSWEPNSRQFGLFAHAAALRYSGNFADPLHPGARLPRVRLWEIWNEENIPQDLSAPDLVTEYRSLLRAGYDQLKRVHGDNVVAVGGLAPVAFEQGFISPLSFAAELLCLRRIHAHYARMKGCVPARFDALAIHPYSLFHTPTLHASHYGDILIADMGKLRELLHAAEHLHTAIPRKQQLWVTEWSWFTNPPNAQSGDSEPLAARYTAYSMYAMWRAGTDLVVWFQATDPANVGVNSPNLIYGGGLYDSSGKPKLMMKAFRFPVVAGVQGARGFVWGRAPVARPVEVRIQRSDRRRWKTIGTVRTGSDGVFDFRFQTRGNGLYRAEARGGAVSLAYDSKPIPAIRTH